MPDKRFLQMTDVAEVLDVSVRQVRALIDRGDLTAVQIGGRGVIRIESSELESYIVRLYDEAAKKRGASAR